MKCFNIYIFTQTASNSFKKLTSSNCLPSKTLLLFSTCIFPVSVLFISSGTKFMIKNSFVGNLNEKTHKNISNHPGKESETVVLNYCSVENTANNYYTAIFPLSFLGGRACRFRNGAL